jgi:hypothetical protein
MWKIIYLFLALFLFSCKPNVSRSGLSFVPVFFGSSGGLEVIYPMLEYNLELGKVIEPIVPTLKGKVESCSSSPAIPAGLNLSEFCVITGLPIEIVSATYTITASNASQSGSRDIILNIRSSKPSLVYLNSPYVTTVGVSTEIVPQVTGEIASCTVAPELPAGLVLGSNCTISGIPATPLLSTEFVVTASNSFGTVTANLNLTVQNLPTVSFDMLASTGAESLGTANLPVSLSFTNNATINYSVTGGTATGGGIDYTLATGTLTFSNGGVTTQNIVLTVIDDTLYESSETVIVTLNVISGAMPGANMTHTYTITDNDTMPTVSFDLGAQNALEGAVNVNVKVILSAISGVETSVPFTMGGTSTAANPLDYNISASPLVIPAGSNSADIIVTIQDDTLDEDDETIVLNMGTPTNATASGTLVHTLTIQDNDPAPDVQFALTSSAGSEATSNVNLDVSLSVASGKTITVNYSVTGGTTTAPDFNLAPGTLTFNPGETTKSITLIINNDTTDEPDETVIVSIDSPVNAILGTITSYTYTIQDDDPPPTVQFAVDTQTVSEGVGVVSITASLSAVSGFEVIVPLTLDASSTAASVADFSGLLTSVTIPAGAIAAGFSIAIVDDSIYEGNEFFKINMGTPTNATLGPNTSQTITIEENDPLPVVSFTSGASISIGEGTGNYGLGFTLSPVSGMPVTVVVNTADGTAVAGSDYTAQVSQVVTIPAGTSTGTLLIPITNDLFAEGNETFTITMSGPGNATLSGINTQTVTILDNDIGISSASTLDCNNNGKIDHYKLTFSANILDSTFPGYNLNALGTVTSDWLVAGYSNLRLRHGTSVGATCAGETDTVDDAVIYLSFDEGSVFDTGAKPDLTTSANPIALAGSGTVAIINTSSVAEADGARPVVVSIIPANGTSGVPLNSTATAVFSEEMDTATFLVSNFTLTGTLSITGSVTFPNSTTVVFTPSVFLANEQLHTVNISNMADINGNVMPAFTSTFTTAIKNKITGTVTGASSNLVLGISVNAGAVTNLTGTTSSYDTGNVLVNGQSFELSIVTQPLGQVCSLLSSPSSPAGGIFNSLTDIVVDVNCVNGFAPFGSGVLTQRPAPNGIHLYQGNVTTLAGANSSTSGFLDGNGTSARFNVPVGLTSDGTYIYTVEENNHAVRRIDSAGNVITFAGNGSPGNTDGTGTIASLCYPREITTDGTFLYVSEYGPGPGGRRIKRIRISTGYTETIAGDNTTLYPTATSLDGIGLSARFIQPAGMVWDNGILFIADRGANKILKMNLSTNQVVTLSTGGSLSQPEGLVLVGNLLYTNNLGNHTIVSIDKTTGTQTLVAGTAGQLGHIDAIGAEARFSTPRSLATDGVHLFVTDPGNLLVRQIHIPTQRVTTIAGNKSPGFLNGVGINSSFPNLGATYFDGKALYVSHSHAIRKITNNALLAYYPLRGNALDYAGSNNLMIAGSSTPTTGTFNEANGAYFIGAGNGFKTSPIATNTNLTMAGWVKIDSYGSEQVLFYNGNSGANGYGFHINPSGEFRLLMGGVNAFPINPKPTVGMWTHLAVVGPQSLPGKWKVYMNGKEIISPTASPNLPASFFSIGISAIDNQNLNGSVTKVRFYNRALNESEVHELAQSAEPAQVGVSFSTGGTGLLSQYTFDGSSFSDWGPLNKTLTNSGTNTGLSKEGDTDGARTFNGSSSLSTTPQGLPLGNAPRTLCAWIHPSKIDVTHSVIAYGVGSPGQAMGLSLQSSKYHFFSYGAGITSSVDARLNTWQHFCGFYDGVNGKIFVDGVELASGSMGTVNTLQGDLKIGINVDNNVPFIGKIDDVRIYNQALSQVSIRQLASQIPTGLVARYDFTGDTNDMSGFGANLTQTGTTSAGVDRFGVANTSRSFNGMDGNFLSVPDNNLPKGFSPRTLCAWYRSESDGGSPDFTSVPISYGTSTRFGLWFQSYNTVRLWTEAGDLNTNVSIPYYVWRHVCMIFTGSGASILVNGRTIGGGNPNVNTNNGNLTIGSWLNSRPFGGQLDEILIYNRALSQEEVRALSGYHPWQLTAWNPSFASSSLKFHLQADSLSNLADNASIPNWADVAGGITGNPFGSPTYQSAGLNGKPAVNLNGASSQYFQYTTANMQSNTATLFVAFQRNSLATYYLIGNLGSAGLYEHYIDSGNSFIYAKNGIGDLVSTTNVFGSTTTPYLLTIQHNQPGATGSAFLAESNVTGSTANAGQTPGGTPTGVNIGASSATGTFWDGKISELIYFHSVLSATDRILVNCYLSSKYGMALDGAAICP